MHIDDMAAAEAMDAAQLRRCPQCARMHDGQRFCTPDCHQAWITEIRADRVAMGISDDRLVFCGGCGRVAMPAIPGRRACRTCERRGAR